METDHKTEALAFLKRRSAGTLATISPEGQPRARTVYYAADDSFALYFLTLGNTRKVEDILAHGRAAFVVSDEEAPLTLQIEGTVADHTDNATMDETLAALKETLFAKGEHFAPVTHLDETRVRFFKLTPDWVRFGDFVHGHGTDETLIEIPL